MRNKHFNPSRRIQTITLEEYDRIYPRLVKGFTCEEIASDFNIPLWKVKEAENIILLWEYVSK